MREKVDEKTKNILLIDKPKGMSSFDVVRRLRRELGTRKIGHAGTLDPLASGLLIIGIGERTKQLDAFLKLPKTYEVEILLGESRTTGDMEGEVIEERAASFSDINRADIEEVLTAMVGLHELPVPRYSAVKVNGEPLYKKARRGEQFDPPLKTMEITGAYLKDAHEESGAVGVEAEISVGSGAYIRSIAEEIGRRLGYPAVTKKLRRTRIGDFQVENARILVS